MKWVKKGLILKADGQHEWMTSHIQNPYAILMEDRVRIFFTTRYPKKNDLFTSIIAYVDLDKTNLRSVVQIGKEPVMSLGEIGSFDEHGIMPGAVLIKNGELWMYYVGWMRSNPAPYSWSIGLAISKDNGKTFFRYSKGPILGRNYNDPFLQNGPTGVLFTDGMYHLFYSSGKEWKNFDGKLESVYLLRHARSDNAIDWTLDEEYCVCEKFENESQTSPTIFEKDGLYHMLFPYRHSYNFRNTQRGYRIGYAYSNDLENWTRDDSQVGIDVSEEGWDSEMICYPHVIKINGRYIMFYCGNGFGQGGLGYAELEM